MSEQINPRNLVLDILLAVDRDGEFLHIVLRNVLDKYRYLPRRDRAFIRRVSEGTVERQIELDYMIDLFSRTTVNKMKPVIRAILRSAVYQLKYMDSVPDSAVCNEAVRLAKKRGFSGLQGFVNGVLRTICRERNNICYPSLQEEPVRALSVRYSVPEWMAERFLKTYGAERSRSIFESFLEKRDVCVRVDVSRMSPDEARISLESQGIRVRPHPMLPYAFRINGYDVLDEIPEFASGILYAQDASSMMVAELARPGEGDFVLDVCAAPGGKSLHIAQMMRGTGMVEARDLTEYKVELIRENIRRCRVENMRAVCRDVLVFDSEMAGRADFVIADLPCSGLGVIGHRPDIKYRMTEDKIRELSELQRRMLGVVRRYVRPGGTLMYSTCTVTAEENSQNTAWFLGEYPEFRLVSEHQYLPDEGCDGFYIAKITHRG
ncbi:MAG: 16S rRNA (cytosine(967)-C(5))-methyltransferase RsmB [Clostridiales bacterium]|nr:16S rRNA (cytosine(967)-C(5))-methyltransferase RsmB [Clostridiales bacterium]